MADLIHNMMDILKKKFKECGVTYYTLENTQSIMKIHNLFIHDKMFEPVNDSEYNHVGLYYEKIKKDYINAEKYYIIATEGNNVNAMNNLAIYYDYMKKDYTNAKKYYIMAIDRGDGDAMNNLAFYYEKNKKKITQKQKNIMLMQLNEVITVQ
jgi:TPR repeat protein